MLERMAAFADESAAAAGADTPARPIRNVINIGIGGSDLGPVMAYEALRHYSRRDMTFRFVSNVDGTDFAEATRDLDPEETLFIICSKTFTTLETLTNARTRACLDACASSATSARYAGILSPYRPTPRVSRSSASTTANMFGFWDWVGGRYSMDSAIGLSTMLADRPGELSRHARRLPRDGRAFPERPVRAQPAGADGTARGLVQQFLRRADGRRCCPTIST